MIQITQISDLLKAKPINEQILKFGRDEVNKEIGMSVVKCGEGLGVDLSNMQIQILTEDIADVYKFDSIEDVQHVLKKIRQGKCGKNYGKLNMIIFNKAMSQHLEEKAIAREHREREAKHDFKTREEYENAVKVGAKINHEQQERKKAERYDQISYEEYKANYEASKKKIN